MSRVGDEELGVLVLEDIYFVYDTKILILLSSSKTPVLTPFVSSSYSYQYVLLRSRTRSIPITCPCKWRTSPCTSPHDVVPPSSNPLTCPEFQDFGAWPLINARHDSHFSKPLTSPSYVVFFAGLVPSAFVCCK